MNNNDLKVAIPGSFRKIADGARLLFSSNPDENISVTLYARRNPHPPGEVKAVHERLAGQLPGERRYLNRTEFNQLFGASPKDIEKIKSWAKANALRVVDEDISKRQVRVEGKIGDFSKAFDTSFHDYEHPTLGKFRGRSGDIFIADDLYKVIDGVFGLDTRPIGRPRFRKSRIVEVPLKSKKTNAATLPAGADLASDFPGAFLPTTVANLYNYPANTDGSGENIAVFAFNGPPGPDHHGGYNLASVQTYFQVSRRREATCNSGCGDPGQGQFSRSGYTGH